MATAERRGLGRGLGELFQRTDSPEPARESDETVAAEEPRAREKEPALVPVPEGSSFSDLPVASIVPNPRQPRTEFDEDAMAELVASIQEVGLLQPVVVRPLGDDGYELVMGERRWRATQRAGLATIPAIVRRTEDHDLLRDALLENLHRAQLNPLEEAAAYQQMLQDFDCTQEELSRRIHRSRPQISNTIRLLRLPASVQRRVAAGVISAGHARALLMITDPAGQERMAQRIVAEGLSVRSTEELVSMGELGEERSPRRRRPRELPEGASRVADRLTDRLDTRVRVEGSARRGRIVIDFASAEDLQRLADLLDR
ncbi:ParB/RepB/Spo0J family partition protein [Auraticoccus monumenti]|uniref:Chromosome partitioning protein, ParB family n=1 Tax=Auraticoccus monumenti TaxID=675864 RepID=A0A1G6U6G0_9ACTN|nr:ParB/RepB/Spo0J family partition protein [Auraticoccus monumenti]SDD36794.1 chromosome partitioning protein, ParB family [Auraticoccus monumenti]